MSPASRHYQIVFRACDSVPAVNAAPRPFGLDKRTLAQVCLLSLLESLKGVDHSVTVFADKCSAELTEFLREHVRDIREGEWGNDESLRRCFDFATTLPGEDWVYLCEDDYLHQPHAFAYIDDLLANRQDILSYSPRPPWMWLLAGSLGRMPVAVFPPDYPDRYHSNRLIPSFCFVSARCHWRQITNTTFTFLAQAATLARHRQVLMRSAQGARDGYLSQRLFARFLLRRKVLCLSPIPGLATHMHEGTMTPLVDWRPLVDEYRKRI